ncbi:histamine H1 receptor-like [Stylophora pistillata]|uniref:Adenosine receptor A2a n=1 Tax=Stylophora pistillata TaxID=50429 RepID=A0A2B4RI42_STYPI|nr:histamine H1 receptor-like [Stylophora pistillata]PFX16048.1 Adenosine receptor A2a [Stylophora pistillata]
MNNYSDHNVSGHQEPLFGFSPYFVYPLASLCILIVVVAIIGNLMVSYAILANRNLRNNPTNLLLLSLAVSDLLTVTLAVPFDIEALFLSGEWKHGKTMCVTFLTVYLITVPTSIFTLLAISVDRYKTLKDPLGRFRRSQLITKRRSLIVIALIWSYCILWALLPIIGWRDRSVEPIYNGACSVHYTIVYNLLTSIMNFIFPLLLTCGFYILIYLIARKHHKVTKTGGFPSTFKPTKEEGKMYTKNIKAAKTTAMFVVVMFLCWQPFTYFSIVANLIGDTWEPYPFELYMVLLMLGYLNSALNPFLFAFRNKRFQSVYRKLLRSITLGQFNSLGTVRQRSTFSQSTSNSQIAEEENRVVRLQSIKSKQ